MIRNWDLIGPDFRFTVEDNKGRTLEKLWGSGEGNLRTAAGAYGLLAAQAAQTHVARKGCNVIYIT